MGWPDKYEWFNDDCAFCHNVELPCADTLEGPMCGSCFSEVPVPYLKDRPSG